MSTPVHSVRASARNDSRVLSLTSLVLGIVSIMGGYVFGAPVIGLVLGILALKREAHRTMAIWGVVLNSIMLAGTVLTILFVVAGVALFTPIFLAGLFVKY